MTLMTGGKSYENVAKFIRDQGVNRAASIVNIRIFFTELGINIRINVQCAEY